MTKGQGNLFEGKPKPPDDYKLYGGTPPHVEGDTSTEAAHKIKPKVNRLQQQVLEVIRAAPDGLTCDAVEARLEGRHQTISARVRELVQLSLIFDTGRREKTRSGRRARVYDVV